MDELPLTLLLDKVARATSAEFAVVSGRIGLTPRLVGLLVAVQTLGSPTQTEVGDWLGVSPSAVVALVDDASKHDLVIRGQDPENRRQTRITLTEAGRVRLKESMRSAGELDDRLLRRLDPAERALLHTALQALAAELGVVSAPDGGIRGPS